MADIIFCPLTNLQYGCMKLGCAFWCDGEKECSIKVLALEAIKRGEK